MEYESCIWCGLKTQIFDGPVHRYLESSPGCWAKYGELLAREYENYEYMTVHGLTVDAYALQHPGRESPQTMSSVYVHLASLYSYIELGKSISELPNIKKEMTNYKDKFIWLRPPEDIRAVTITDILKSETASQHCINIKKWAEYVFEKWSAHHSKIANILAANS